MCKLEFASICADKYYKEGLNMTDFRPSLLLKGSGYNLPLSGPASVLSADRGIIFPLTPNITIGNSAAYSVYDITHTNYQQTSYIKTANPTINVSAPFASQTIDEAKYLYGVIHFLRVASKMNWGRNDPDAGTPPPVLSFSGYGDYTNVPVVIAQFNLTYDSESDYVNFTSNGKVIHIPVVMTLAIDLMTHYSAARQNTFNLADFASGSIYKSGFI
jgi:hypothetical protein